MLNRFRQSAPAVITLLCVALLAAWLTGAHAHRHVGGHLHDHSPSAWGVVEQGHSHEQAPAHDALVSSSETLSADHDDDFAGHAALQHHADGHDDVETQLMQPRNGVALPDLPLLAVLLFCAVFVLPRSKTFTVVAINDPPDPRRTAWSLRPPLRGPPSFSIA